MRCAIWVVFLLSTSVARADEREDKAVKAVEALGGQIGRNDKAPGKPIVFVNLSLSKITDTGLKELAVLTKLESLDLSLTTVTDAGVNELRGFKELKSVWLLDCKVSDTGVNTLATLSNLEVLVLNGTNITDTGLKRLAGLKKLRTLVIPATTTTAAAVAELRRALPKCEIYDGRPREQKP